MSRTLLKESINQFAIKLFSDYRKSLTTRLFKTAPVFLQKFGIYHSLAKCKSDLAAEFVLFIDELHTSEDSPDEFINKIKLEIERITTIIQTEKRKLDKRSHSRGSFLDEEANELWDESSEAEDNSSEARLERSFKLFDVYVSLTKSFYSEYQHGGSYLLDIPAEEQNRDPMLILKLGLVDYLVINGTNNMGSLSKQVAYGKRLGRELVHYRNNALAGNKASLVRDWLPCLDEKMAGHGAPGSYTYKQKVLEIAEQIRNFESVVRSESKFTASFPLMVSGYTLCSIPIEHEPGGGEFLVLLNKAIGRIKVLPTVTVTPNTTPAPSEPTPSSPSETSLII